MAESDPPVSAGRMPRHLSFQFIRLPDRHFTFDSTVIEATDDHIILTQHITPSAPLRYRGQEVLGDGYRAVWFLFKGEPFDVARVYRPDGTWTGYYADVLDPVDWAGSDPQSLRPLVDLFLDLWITPEGDYQILDEDELAAALADGAITSTQATTARRVLDNLVQAVRAGDFPPPITQHFELQDIRGPL